MLGKTSVFMMVLLVVASLIGISSIYQYEEGQVPPAATSQPQQQVQRSGPMVGKITHTIVYASSDGKACLANAQISTTLYRPNYPLGLEPGDSILLLASDESICDVLNQLSITKREIQFLVALAPLTLKAIPPTLRADFPSSQSLYRVVEVIAK
jgi:hypothetical protein